MSEKMTVDEALMLLKWMTEDRDKLWRAFEEQERRIAGLGRNVDLLVQEKKKLRDELVAAIASLNETRVENERLRVDRDRLQVAYIAEAGEAERLREENERAKEVVGQNSLLITENARLRKENADMRSQVGPVATQNRELLNEVERLREYEKFASQTHDAVVKLGEAREENERLSGQLGSESARAHTYAAQLVVLRDENERLRAENAFRGWAEVKRLRDKLTKWELSFPQGPGVSADKVQTLVEEVERLRGAREGMRRLADDNETLYARVAELETEIERLQKHHGTHHQVVGSLATSEVEDTLL